MEDYCVGHNVASFNKDDKNNPNSKIARKLSKYMGIDVSCMACMQPANEDDNSIRAKVLIAFGNETFDEENDDLKLKDEVIDFFENLFLNFGYHLVKKENKSDSALLELQRIVFDEVFDKTSIKYYERIKDDTTSFIFNDIFLDMYECYIKACCKKLMDSIHEIQENYANESELFDILVPTRADIAEQFNLND